MFDSAKIGLAYLQGKCDKILFTPVDIPLFTADTVRAVLGSGAELAFPVCEGRPGHPIMLSSPLIPALLADSGEEGMQGALSRCGGEMTPVPVEDAGILHDADTPEDYRALLKYHNRQLVRPVVSLALARELSGPALDARYVTNGVAHARLLAQKDCKVFLVGGLLRPETEAIIGAAALHSLQQYNFTKAFLGANGVALDAGFTTPDPEEAAVKAAVVRRAREAWFLVDDSKFARIYPAVIAELSGGAILTNHCPNPKYRQFTLVKEAAE